MESWLLSDFSASDNFVYLDTAGRSAIPKQVESKGLEALIRKSRPWMGMGQESDIEDVRRLFARLISAPIDSIAICHSTSYAISTAARNVTQMGILKPGKFILVLENEMGSAVYAWQQACLETGAAKLRVILDTCSAADWADAIILAIDDSISVIAIPNVHWCDGSYIDLEKISAHLATLPAATRPLLIVDGTQSIGALDFDVTRIKPAFLACSVHKWLCSPYGCSLVYLDPEYHSSWQPIDFHERSRLGSDNPQWDELGAMDNQGIADASRVLTGGGYPLDFKPGARRLDSGGRPNPILIPMIKEALGLILDWKPCHIQAKLADLTNYLVDEIVASKLPITVKPREQRSGHIIGLRLQPEAQAALDERNVSVGAIGAALKERGVFVSVRAGGLRVAPYVYNTREEIGRFLVELADILKELRLV
jgi:selenocysteine lyase/cysteine desulfurase